MYIKINNRIAFRNSWTWIQQSFKIFREAPVHFIVLGMLQLLVAIPIINTLVGLMLAARMAKIANQIENNEKVAFSSILRNLWANHTLVKLVFISLLISLFLAILQFLVKKQFPGSGLFNEIIYLIPVFFLQIAIWLSPIICLYNPEISPIFAMQLSIKFVFLNFGMFIIYFLMLIVFTILAVIPLGLGLLVWIPMMNIGSYLIYKNAFAFYD